VTLYPAAVPPARQALARAAALVDRLGERSELWSRRLAPDMLDAGAQVRTVAGFALRATLPLAGQAVPDLTGGLRPRLDQAAAIIFGLDPQDFQGAEARVIRHRAGFAELTQDGASYLHLFALPNLWFHLSMAHATLRAAGLALGKADFDGWHSYPAGFRWD
jgi:hypothetical protein